MSTVGIMSAWNYAFSVWSACVVLGIAVFLFDRMAGVHAYRFLYDFFHKNPMPTDVERGFLYGQSSNRGVSVAGFLSTAYTLYTVWELGFKMNFIAELIVWVFMIPALVVGFWAGRLVHKLLLRRSEYFDKADALGEKLEHLDLGEVKERVRTGGSTLLSGFNFGLRRKAQEPPVVVPAAPPVPEPDYTDALDRYKRRK